MDALLVESFERFVSGLATPAAVREVERDAAAAATMWPEIERSGFLDLLVPESLGGSGAGLREAFGPWMACGRQTLPLPLAQTMWARGVLAAAGIDPPMGPIAIAGVAQRQPGCAWHCPAVPFGSIAQAVLVSLPEGAGAWLWPLAGAERRPAGVHGSQQATLELPPTATGALRLPGDVDLAAAGALVTAVLMAGALERLLSMTLQYANDREQFGKPIGKFQAVQQQLAVLAEQAFAARMAAELGCADEGVQPHALRAAVAKARAGEAAEKAVAIAHAVHGAIGVTAEFDLHLVTRRLQEWRGDHGAAPYWHARLGRALLEARDMSVVPFLLDAVLPSEALREGGGP